MRLLLCGGGNRVPMAVVIAVHQDDVAVPGALKSWLVTNSPTEGCI